MDRRQIRDLAQVHDHGIDDECVAGPLEVLVVLAARHVHTWALRQAECQQKEEREQVLRCQEGVLGIGGCTWDTQRWSYWVYAQDRLMCSSAGSSDDRSHQQHSARIIIPAPGSHA